MYLKLFFGLCVNDSCTWACSVGTSNTGFRGQSAKAGAASVRFPRGGLRSRLNLYWGPVQGWQKGGLEPVEGRFWIAVGYYRLFKGVSCFGVQGCLRLQRLKPLCGHNIFGFAGIMSPYVGAA